MPLCTKHEAAHELATCTVAAARKQQLTDGIPCMLQNDRSVLLMNMATAGAAALQLSSHNRLEVHSEMLA